MLVSIPVLVACNDAKKACEHARDAMNEMWTRLGKEALATVDPAERAAAQKTMDEEHARASGRFVERCIALPEPAAKCIGRIDEILRAEQDGRAARGKCARDENGLPNQKCEEAAEAKTKAVMGECETELKSFNDALFAD